jgi:hypothetical protein
VRTLVEPKGLLVEIGVEVNRVNADVGSLKGALQEAPEVLDAVRVYVVANELDGVVNGLMIVGVAEAEIRFQRIGVDGRSRLDAGTNLWCQGAAFYIRNVRCLYAAGSIVRTALDNAEDRFLARAASPLDLSLARRRPFPRPTRGPPPAGRGGGSSYGGRDGSSFARIAFSGSRRGASGKRV